MKHFIKSGFVLLTFLISHVCLSQVNEQNQITSTVGKFLKYLSYTDTLSLKVDSLYSVFTPEAKLTANFGKESMTFTLRQFIENIYRSNRSGRTYSAQEHELARKIDVFGKIAHVWSTYELTLTGKDGKTTRRGINSIQLLKREGKWLIYSVIWDRESDDLKLPAAYLREN